MMDFVVWYLDTDGTWKMFYHYGDNFHAAITDARGTLGIDEWAITNQNCVRIAHSKGVDLRGLQAAAVFEKYGAKSA